MSERARLQVPRHRPFQPRAPAPATDAHEPAGPGNQDALARLGLRAKLTVSQPSDPDEMEADRAADAFAGGQSAPRIGAAPGGGDRVQRQCTDCEETVKRKPAATGPSPAAAAPRLDSGSGAPLPRSTRTPYERFFGADLSGVRIHNDGSANAAAAGFQAKAFTRGPNIYFGSGHYNPDSSDGRRLLAHELTHTLQPALPTQVRREPQAGALPANAEANDVARTIAALLLANDVGGAVSRLRGRSIVELKAMRQTIHDTNGLWIEEWLVGRMAKSDRDKSLIIGVGSLLTPSVVPLAVPVAKQLGWTDPAAGGTAEEGLRWLWPALPLVSKLLVYDQGYREIEQAQLDVIRSSSRDARDEAWNNAAEKARLLKIFEKMDAREEYKARLLFDDKSQGLMDIADRMIKREAKDGLYDAFLLMPPLVRKNYFNDHWADLRRLLGNDDLRLIESMVRVVSKGKESFGGSEVDALIARLRLATEDRSDDMDAVQSTVDRAVALLKERRELQKKRHGGKLNEEELTEVDRRLDELRGLDRLFEMHRDEDGKLIKNSFMRLLSDARDDPDGFLTDAQRFAEFAPTGAHARNLAFQIAKQRILLAGSDLERIRAIIYSTSAPAVEAKPGETKVQAELAQWQANVQLRKDLLDDPQVISVVRGLKPSEQRQVVGAVSGDEFDATLYQVNEANRNAQWAQLFTLVLRIARNDAWRSRYDARRGEFFGTHSWIFGDQRKIVEAILRDQKLPLDLLLEFGNPELLKVVLDEMPEQQRARLRKGWALSKKLVSGELKDDDKTALAEFEAFIAKLRGSHGDVGDYETVLGAALGAAPSTEEMATGEGRYAAAAQMWERIEARTGLARGASASFTESDETMEAAAREFAGQWLQLKNRDPRQITTIELAALTALFHRFSGRAEEFAADSNKIGELASMIAATVAGIIVVVATGGAATPAVIALAAASGASARVVTREMFGADYYNALSDKGARDALLGAMDGALAVVSSGLAAKGVELAGLGGKALTSGAARIAGTVAEQASQPLARRVAAGAVEAAIDGLLSGAASEAFGAFLDDATWRRGILDGLVRVGQAALVGGLTGLATGGLIGAAAPVVGAGAKRLWQAVAGQSLERTLEKAGRGEVLAAARKAAREGEVEQANKLSRELEEHLAPEEVLALRRELNDSLRERLGRPPGTATPKDDAQRKLLEESGHHDVPPSAAHQEAELDLVARSDPQPSSQPGYIDEVDLGNGHSWKRQADGSWCRFSEKPNLCALVPKAKKMNATERQLAEAAFYRLEEIRANLRAAREIADQYPGIVDKLRKPPPRRTPNLDALTAQEKEILSQVFPSKELEELTLADVTRSLQPNRASGLSLPEIEYHRLLQAEEAAILKLRESSQPLYDKLRAASPRQKVRDAVIKKAEGLDQVSGAKPISGELDADHVVPLRQIYDMPGFKDLDWDDQVAIANDLRNFRGVDSSVNRSRQASSWYDNFPMRGTYSSEAIAAIQKEEDRIRGILKGEIEERLKNAPKKARK